MEVGALSVVDLNQDGFSDVVVAPGVSDQPMTVRDAYQPLLFMGSEQGITAVNAFPSLTVCSQSILAHDFNADGAVDLLFGGYYIPGAFPNPCPSLLLLQDTGGFIRTQVSWLPDDLAIEAMLSLDIDRDEDEDIMLTGHWSGVHLLRKNDRDFVHEELRLPSGWWNCIKAADLDDDGNWDLVLGNEGLNSIYKASDEQPLSLLAKDFNEDGSTDPIWGVFLKDKEVAIHPLGTLSDQIIQYRKRFQTYKEYSAASLDDLFTSGDLRGVSERYATEIRTGIAFNNGDGRFTFTALPFEAQQSPVNDVLVEDLNSDGTLDVLLVGNNFAKEPIFGQNDASFGTFLSGRGDGTFDAIPTRESGLKLDGDMRKITYLKHEKLIIVTENQGNVRLYGHHK